MFQGERLGYSYGAGPNGTGYYLQQRPADNFLEKLAQAEARDTQTGGPPVEHYRRQQQTQAIQQHAYQHHHLPPSRRDYQHQAAYRRDHQPEWAYENAAEAQIQHQLYAPPGAKQENRPVPEWAYEQTAPGNSRQQRKFFEPLASQVDMVQPGGNEGQYRRPNWLATRGPGSHPNDRPAGGPGNLAGRSNAHGVQLRAQAAFMPF